MSLRPLPARWFEMLTVRDDAARALEALARTGAVELEAQAGGVFSVQRELGGLLDEFKELARRYAPYWPQGVLRPSPRRATLAAALTLAMQQLRGWQRAAEPLIGSLEEAQEEEAELALWQKVLAGLEQSALDVSLLATAGPVLATRFFVLPPDNPPLVLPAGTLATHFDLGELHLVLVVCPRSEVAELVRQATKLKARCLAPIAFPCASARDNLAEFARRRVGLAEEIAALTSALDNLAAKYNLLRTLGDIGRLEWLADEAPALPATENFVIVTGWTSDFSDEGLAAALRRRRIRALMHFPPPPPGARPPLLQHNPGWARPFELFARAFGTPAGYEADPSRLVAAIAPLLFGYMFGDVGQGLLLAAGGWLLRDRLPAARLILAGGVSATLFGLLFGSVFSREDLLPALWLHPLEAPLTVLALPVVGGALLLGLGLGLGTAQARWRRPGSWPAEAGLLPMYVGGLAAFFHPLGAVIALAGTLWFLVNRIRPLPGLRALVSSMGELLEHAFQLAVGTLSFTRVGAFALAHAGLAEAIAVIAAATPGPVSGMLVQVGGNVLAVTLEALVVSVQTTRLVLFEFFIRFLRGEGRPFRPLPAPRTSV